MDSPQLASTLAAIAACTAAGLALLRLVFSLRLHTRCRSRCCQRQAVFGLHISPTVTPDDSPSTSMLYLPAGEYSTL